MQDKITQYDLTRASQYDYESLINQGNRNIHMELLDELLSFLDKFIFKKPNLFIELGCGTGFFSELFLKKFSDMEAHLIDGSSSMLTIAQQKLENYNKRVKYSNELFEDLTLDKYRGKVDIIFSSLAIHHLKDKQKCDLFKKIYNWMNYSSAFILLDLHKPKEFLSSKLLEFMACMQIRKKTINHLNITHEIEELSIKNIILKDRKIKSDEKDQETTINKHIMALNKVGFNSITIFYQETRLFGLVALKLSNDYERNLQFI